MSKIDTESIEFRERANALDREALETGKAFVIAFNSSVAAPLAFGELLFDKGFA